MRVTVEQLENDPSMTKQSFAEVCDINNIMSRFTATGIVDHVAKFEGRYGDATGQDFTKAMQLVASAQSMFNELPSKTRNAFYNEPAQFLDFVNNLDNSETTLNRLVELEMMTPEEARTFHLANKPTNTESDSESGQKPTETPAPANRETEQPIDST